MGPTASGRDFCVDPSDGAVVLTPRGFDPVEGRTTSDVRATPCALAGCKGMCASANGDAVQ